MASQGQRNPSILMLPWLAHGHLSPFLELAKRLAQRNFHIYLCSTPASLEPIRQLNLSPSIRLIEINLPSSQELPPHLHTTRVLPPHLMSALKTAFDHAKPAFQDILKTLKPNLVIYDFLQPWAPIVCGEENIKSVLFLICGAAISSYLIHYSMNPHIEYPFPSIDFPETERQILLQMLYDVANNQTGQERYLKCVQRSSGIVLIKTSKELEDKYIDHLSCQIKKEIVPVGPLVQDFGTKEDDGEAIIMEWLGKREPSSVVFVSFGSEYFLSKEEIEEIAHGLELSKVSFIWVVRFHAGERTRLHEVLPEGFQARVGERGMIVEGWAPQGKILRHGSVGGFMSHCGWGSTLEGVMFGAPIIAMPMHLDQPLNAKLVVEIGVGVEVRRENRRYRREEVARVVKQVVVDEEGNEVRKKVKELSQRMRERGDEEVDVVVEKLMQLV